MDIFRVLIVAIAVLSSTLPRARAEVQHNKATLEGTVVSLTTGQILKNVHLVLQPENRAAGERSTSTSADGAFQFFDVEPGKYRLFAERSGFDPQYYAGSGVSPHQGTILTVQSGTTLKDLAIKLNPYGAVCGRVVDEEGEPLVHASVQAMRHIYLRGKSHLIAAGQGMTDDLGEYRIFELPAGQYVVQAKASGEPLIVEQSRFAFAPSYYPNTEDLRSATGIILAPGQVQYGMDFQLRHVPTVTIQGQIAASPSELRGVMVYLLPRVAAGLAEKSPIPVVDGSFKLPAVLPGSYVLVADQFGENGGVIGSARLELEVLDQDIKGVTLTLIRPGDLIGRVRLESSRGSAASLELTDGRTGNLQVSLQRLDDETSFVAAPVNEAGRFRLKSVSPGIYRVLVNNLNAGLYVKSIRVGDYDVSEAGLDLSKGALSGEISITLSANGGGLKGNVHNEDGTSTGGAQVVAMPISSLYRPKTVIAESNGHYEIKGLAPGEYRVFAFQEIEPGAAEDADFMKQFADKSGKVTIHELGTETVDPAMTSPGLARGEE